MIPILREFQAKLKADVRAAWENGARNVLMRLDTGGGKTVTLADLVRENIGAAAVIAHRQELVGQLSLTLARYGVRHNIVASTATKRAIAKSHVEELGYCMFDPASSVVVASVDTLIKADGLDQWFPTVTLWVVDEGHHVVIGNKWHTVISRFTHPQCRGLLPTATPKRADGKGLGRPEANGDGVADVMVCGPPMRWLIDQGFLCDYRIICPASDMQVLADVSASGDWSTAALREAAKRSHIVGDVVASYLQYARGKLGITFSTDVETAKEMSFAYNRAGVRAETLTGKTDDGLRRSILKRFAAREIMQIVAVDIISEGFDLPAIEVASMARPTASLALYMQQFGRTLRPMPGKDKAIILDHAGNVIRHNGPPDKPRAWSLERRGKRASSTEGEIPVKRCLACFEPYEATFRECPHCGHYEPPAERSSPAAVAGDMVEMDVELLRSLRGEIEAVDKPYQDRRAELMETNLPHVAMMATVKRHRGRQEAQAALRQSMAQWGGWHTAEGLTDGQIQRRFFFTFGIDVLSAQALGAKEAADLQERIDGAK